MTSRWEWLDYSENDQKRIRELLSPGGESDAVDPLRLGAAVRDRVADTLFPGTSTLHRRLRYAILVPALFRSRPRVNPSEVPTREEQWNRRLWAANKDKPGIVGVFGSQVPSTRFVPAYWNSIRTWGFFTVADRRDATQPKAIASMHAKVERDEDGNPIGDILPMVWHPRLVELCDELLTQRATLPTDASVYCSREEAEFILERWSSLELGRRAALSSIADAVAGRLELAPRPAFPWQLSLPGPKEAPVRADLAAARAISFVCWTLHLAYNLALMKQARAAEKHGDDAVWMKYPGRMDDTEVTIERQVGVWKAALDSEMSRLERWADEQAWFDSGMVATGAPLGTVHDLATTTRRLLDGDDDLTKPRWVGAVRKREQLKGFSARLSHPAALAAWTGTPEMADRWDFRWRATSNILRDIERATARADSDG